MSEEKNVLEQVIEAIKKLLGFGTDEQIAGVVNGIVDAQGDEAGVVGALQGLFGEAVPQADLLSVVQDVTAKGNGIDLNNMLDLFQGIGDKVGGFDKIANLMGAAPSAGGVTDAIADVASSVTGAVKGAAGAATDAAGAVADGAADAAGAAVDTAKNAVGSVTGAVKEAAGAAGGAAAGAAHAATGAVKGAAHKVADTATGAVDGVKQVAAEPAKKRKKWPITLGVIAAIVALAGIGMWIWHEQPSFCSTMCHTSMNAYVEMYDQEDNVAGVDKYGNDVANTHAMLAVSHKAAKNMTCLSCHIPALDQQIGEVMETITGNYTVVERVNGNGYALPEVALAELQENAHLVNDSGKGDEFCLRSGCHDFTRDVLAKATESMEFNPHIAQHGEIACGECHKSHRASVFYCTQCHAEASNALPEGWLTYQEGQKANIA